MAGGLGDRRIDSSADGVVEAILTDLLDHTGERQEFVGTRVHTRQPEVHAVALGVGVVVAQRGRASRIHEEDLLAVDHDRVRQSFLGRGLDEEVLPRLLEGSRVKAPALEKTRGAAKR